MPAVLWGWTKLIISALNKPNLLVPRRTKEIFLKSKCNLKTFLCLQVGRKVPSGDKISHCWECLWFFHVDWIFSHWAAHQQKSNRNLTEIQQKYKDKYKYKSLLVFQVDWNFSHGPAPMEIIIFSSFDFFIIASYSLPIDSFHCELASRQHNSKSKANTTTIYKYKHHLVGHRHHLRFKMQSFRWNLFTGSSNAHFLIFNQNIFSIEYKYKIPLQIQNVPNHYYYHHFHIHDICHF